MLQLESPCDKINLEKRSLEMRDFKDVVLKTRLRNTDEKYVAGNPEFDTRDYLFFETYDEVKGLNPRTRCVQASDYAVMNGVLQGGIRMGASCKQTSAHYLRTANSDRSVVRIETDGDLSICYPDRRSIGLCPSLRLNLSSVISARKEPSNDFEIEPVKDKYENVLYHVIEFGTYPQDHAKNSDQLEELFKAKKLTPTGKVYVGYMKKDGTFQQNKEFEYLGKKYVRVISNKHDNYSKYGDNTPVPEIGEPAWAEVQPIRWKIKNWEELPKALNPNGDGTAKSIYVKAEEALLSGIPFFPTFGEKNQTMWQNSPLRAIFNGYDLSEEIDKGNGNKNYKTSKNFDFKGKGFLQEAFDFSSDKEEEYDNQIVQKRQKTRINKLNPDKTPVDARRKMTDTETIKSWIDAGQSVLLRGPSGIGKTQRIKTLFPNLIYIKLTNNMFPEKVVGSMNLQTGQSIPPEFAKQALLACATDSEKKLIQKNIQNLYELADTIYERSKTSQGKIVIMLDELLNVKPAVQSLVYSLVLNRLVETGKGLKLPENTVIVATGNQKKYSTVAEDLAEPLEKRFDHIFDMEPKVGEWIYEYAIPEKIHPSVIGYIFSKYQENRRREEIGDIGYFYEEPEVGEANLDKNGCRGRTNDPRGWESVSQTLYAFEADLKNGKFVGKDVESLLKTSIKSKLREEWAEEFFDFYNNPTLTVEEIVDQKYSQEDLPRDINEKFATMAGLLNASFDQVEACREFIRKNCDPEYLSVFDMYWAGNDDRRMEKISELQETQDWQNGDVGGFLR